MKQLCEQCGKRRAMYIRRSRKYRGAKSNLIIKSDKHHAMCGRCADAQFQSILQSRLAEKRSE